MAPVNETDMILFPKGLKALKQVAKEVGLDLRGAYLNLDGGFDFPIGGFSAPEGRLARGFKPPAFSRFLFQSAVKSAESF